MTRRTEGRDRLAAAPGGLVGAWWDHCRTRAAMRRTLVVALSVGTVLTLVHDGGALAAGALHRLTPWKIAANYVVPWLVSSTGYISARRATVARSAAVGAELTARRRPGPSESVTPPGS